MSSVYWNDAYDEAHSSYHVTRVDTNTGRATLFWYDSVGVGQALEYKTFDPATGAFGSLMRQVQYRSLTDNMNAGWNGTYYNIPGNVILLGDGDDNVTYTAIAEQIFAGGGNDRIDAGDGHNVVHGEGGDDILTGGKGNDILMGEGGHDVLFGGGGNNNLFGGSGDDEALGGAGNDFLVGGLGLDRLLGYGGDDFIYDLYGRNQIYGGSGQDFVVTGADGSTTSLGADDDIMHGGAGVDAVHGDDGNDVIDGGAGVDRLYGDYGNDTLYADTPGTAPDTKDLLYGGANEDTLYAGGGRDRLFGGDGLDQLFTGVGQAYMYGGTGKDAFHLDTFSSGNDHRIEDFSRAEGDQISVGVLQGYTAGTSAVDDFVRLVTRDATRTDIKVNVDGTGGGWTILATLLNVDLTGVTATDLVSSSNLFLG